MPKKSFKILDENIGNNYILNQIVEINDLYVVLYENSFFSIKISNKLTDHPGPKYKKMVFVSENQATKTAKKLNEKFKTDKFSVRKISNFKNFE